MIIVPVIVVLTLLVVQFVLVWHGRHVAQAAAQTAARSAAAYQAQPAAGQAAGDDYLAEVAPEPAPRPHGHRHQGRHRRHRVVTADVLTVIPFAAFHIQEQATAPLEIFVGTP